MRRCPTSRTALVGPLSSLTGPVTLIRSISGAVTVADEAAARLVRGQRAHHARFGGPSPIVPRIDGTSSLYELQATDPSQVDDPQIEP